MRKIRLEIGELSVESFDALSGDPAKAETVRGNAATLVVDGCPNISRGTCFQSCGTDYRPCIEPYC